LFTARTTGVSSIFSSFLEVAKFAKQIQLFSRRKDVSNPLCSPGFHPSPLDPFWLSAFAIHHSGTFNIPAIWWSSEDYRNVTLFRKRFNPNRCYPNSFAVSVMLSLGLIAPLQLCKRCAFTPTLRIPSTSPGLKSDSISNKPRSLLRDFIENLSDRLRML